jgi:hypothetical protein
MTTYVLGAGASRHGGYPLANELGGALRDWIHSNKNVNDDYRVYMDQTLKLYGHLENFEEILTDLVECEIGSRAATIQGPIRRLLLWALRESLREFFNHLRTRPADHYERLAQECVQSGDVIITFNYDVALERALKQAGIWEIGDGYGFSLDLEGVPPSRIKVLKLHGSTSWWTLLLGGHTGFSGGGPAALGDRPVIWFKPEFEFLGYPPETVDYQCRGLGGVSGHTAIIMPILRKRFYEQTSFGRELEPFWQGLWHEAARTLRSSQEIVIIGYSMAAADQKARDLLFGQSNPGARISVFCGPRTNDLCREFQDRGFQQTRTYRQGLFEDYLDAI